METQGGMHRIIDLAMKVLYPTQIIGLLIRGVAIFVSLAIPYSSWNIFLRIGIEIVVGISMLGLAEIIAGHASAALAGLRDRKKTVRTDPRYLATGRMSKENLEAKQFQLNKARQLAMTDLQNEVWVKLGALVICAGITVVYGAAFLTMMSNGADTKTLVISELIAILSVPFFTWYVNAEYRPHQVNPAKRAEDIMLGAFDGRLLKAKERFDRGEETEEDRILMRAAVSEHSYHSELIQALSRPAEGVTYYRTPELYALLGAQNASDEAKIRGRVRAAGKAWLYGVIKDVKSTSKNKDWLTPDTSVVKLFGDMITGVSVRRRKASGSRVDRPAEAGIQANLAELSSSSARSEANEPVGVVA